MGERQLLCQDLAYLRGSCPAVETMDLGQGPNPYNRSVLVFGWGPRCFTSLMTRWARLPPYQQVRPPAQDTEGRRALTRAIGLTAAIS